MSHLRDCLNECLASSTRASQDALFAAIVDHLEPVAGAEGAAGSDSPAASDASAPSPAPAPAPAPAPDVTPDGAEVVQIQPLETGEVAPS